MVRGAGLVVLLCAGAWAQPAAERDVGWDAVLTRASGWNGGDIGHSVDLGDGRTLWLFGDSIVGPVRDGARVGGESKFVRGAIGWHETGAGGEPPGEMSFAIPEAFGDALVAGWTRPAEGVFDQGAWYWLMGDGEVVWDSAGARRFVFFATAIGPAGNPEGMWDFRQVGGAVITARNVGDRPDRWEGEQAVNPLVGEGARFGEEAGETDNWGLAVVGWPPDAPIGSRTLYVYGVRSRGPGTERLVVARCAEDDLDAPSRWLFYDGEGWSAEPADAAGVASGLVSEFTVETVSIPEAEGQALVLVQSEPMLGRRILVRTAGDPWGPWSAPAPVFEVPDPGEDDRLMTYAAKGHAHLSRPGELLVSYVVNSTDFGQIFRDAGLYRPRFVRVPLEALPLPPE